MGSLYVLGIPFFEDAEAADKRRNDKNKRKKIEEQSDVQKKRAAEESERARAATGTNVGGTLQGVTSSVMEPASSLFGGVGEGFASGNLSMSIPGVGSLTGTPSGPPGPSGPDAVVVLGGVLLLGLVLLMGRR